MPEQPTGKRVNCPECNTSTIAIVPNGTRIVDDEDGADGKVRAACLSCEHRFEVHFRDVD